MTDVTMKKILFILVLIGVLASQSFAKDVILTKQKVKPQSSPSHKAIVTLEVVGKVDAVTLEDPAKGIRSQIAITDEGGNSFTLLVKSTTTIYGPDWKAITLDKLGREQLVRVQYIKNKEGFLTALSIKPVMKR